MIKPIKINNISKSYGEKKVLRNLTLEIHTGTITVLRGASGCGKTTLLKILAGLEKQDSGTVELSGKISMVFQENRLLPWLTALENVAAVSNKRTASKYLDLVGLGDNEDKFPEELSGGMCRRLAIARALSYGGDILILDEPFTGLDSELKTKISDLFKVFPTVILSTHDDYDAKETIYLN